MDNCCVGENVSIAYSECVFSLRYPACNAHAPYYIVICGLAGCTIFSTLSNKRHDFGRKVIEYETCVLILSTILFAEFLILRRNERDMKKNAHGSSCKATFIHVRF